LGGVRGRGKDILIPKSYKQVQNVSIVVLSFVFSFLRTAEMILGFLQKALGSSADLGKVDFRVFHW